MNTIYKKISKILCIALIFAFAQLGFADTTPPTDPKTFTVEPYSSLGDTDGNGQMETLYVRLNPNPFAAPYYIFSSTENGPAESIQLLKGLTYEFIRTDGGHPFNIGSGWREADPSVTLSSTSNSTNYAVSGVGSIQVGDRLTLNIPENFIGSSLAYYCYSHSPMVANLVVLSSSTGGEDSLDTDSDGMPDVWEIRYGLNPNDSSDASSDQDNDGISALDEYIAGTIPVGSLDLDGNGQYDALTDGLLLLRGMFGLTESALNSGAVAADGVYTSPNEVTARIDILGDLVDIDGNGQVDALTDGLVILRYLFGLRDDVLINGVIASDATVTSAVDVGAKIESLKPSL